MDRRNFLFGVSGGIAICAGCTGDETTDGSPSDEATDDASSDETTEETADLYEEFPDTDELLDEHFSTLGDTSFEAAEYIEQAFPGQNRQTTERTIRSGDAGALFRDEETEQNRAQEVWFTDRAEIDRRTHTYYPGGVVPPIMDRSGAEEIIEIAEFEQVETTEAEESAVVFEAAGPSEAGEEADVDFQSIDVTVEIAAPGYIRLMDAEIEFTQSPDTDETAALIYEYQVSDVGEVSVTPPEFVADTLRVEADLTDDGSAIMLEHAGGPTVEADTALIFQDAEHISMPDRGGPTFSEEFAESDTAYVYWTGDEEAAISIDQEPSSVAREIAFPSERGERDVYLQEEAGPGPERFAVRLRSDMTYRTL